MNNWEQVTGESDRAFAAFVVYRDLPARSRSFGRAASIYYGVECVDSSGKVRQFSKWSSRWEWVDRVRAYDQWLDRANVTSTAEEIAAMARRHTQAARDMVGKAIEALAKVDPATLTVPQIALYLELGIKLERLSRGEPADVASDETAGVQQDTIRDLLGKHPELAGPVAELAAKFAELEASARGESPSVLSRRRRLPGASTPGTRKGRECP